MDQYSKTRFWVGFMGYWAIGGIPLGAIFNFLIPYLVGGFFILLIISIIQGHKFDKKLEKEDKELHKKFSKNVKEIIQFVFLWRLSVLLVYAIYLLVLKFLGIDITLLRIVVGFIVMTIIYWILHKKGLLGFASSEKKWKN